MTSEAGVLPAGVSSSRGVYFLANDHVLELAVAFLNSFRAHNPTMPLCFIPFDCDAVEVARMQGKYGFSVYRDGAILRRCDAISQRFHGRTIGHYRKLAAWEGPLEDFLYIDVDTVILDAIDFVFAFLWSFDFVTSHSNSPSLERWVWKRSIDGTGRLTDRQRAFSANTGFIASKKGALRLEAAERSATLAATLAPHMNLECQEQPFLNYLMVTAGGRYTSLAVLSTSGNPYPIKLEHWAGRKGATIRGGQLSPVRGRPPVLLVHWAGEWQARTRDHLLNSVLRWLGFQRPTGREAMRFRMPYGRLWRYYRWLR